MPPRRNDPEKDSPHMKPSRRAVITASALGLGAATIARAGAPIGNAARFSMKYAPHEGSFASRGGLVEQITFAADQGFTAWEDNEAVADRKSTRLNSSH